VLVASLQQLAALQTSQLLVVVVAVAWHLGLLPEPNPGRLPTAGAGVAAAAAMEVWALEVALAGEQVVPFGALWRHMQVATVGSAGCATARSLETGDTADALWFMLCGKQFWVCADACCSMRVICGMRLWCQLCLTKHVYVRRSQPLLLLAMQVAAELFGVLVADTQLLRMMCRSTLLAHPLPARAHHRRSLLRRPHLASLVGYSVWRLLGACNSKSAAAMCSWCGNRQNPYPALTCPC
jgi:hypothetical protein